MPAYSWLATKHPTSRARSSLCRAGSGRHYKSIFRIILGEQRSMKVIDAPPGYEICAMPDGEFAAMIGPLLIRQCDSGPRFAFRAERKHTNARGVVHGGMLTSFADQALGLTIQLALNTLDLATVNLNCNLVASARPGDLIEGAAAITRITNRL